MRRRANSAAFVPGRAVLAFMVSSYTMSDPSPCLSRYQVTPSARCSPWSDS
ncbi:hypothetical protein PF002_g32548 [Phytophthora fragariae]|uniref:Uncharacterized protein n=1 Tax=Phytophthora fragariae TaxID=53985 RepID=A0A6A3PG54_9STRA|nr:hypothetical protein PF003_g28051 [Phytophthora fragariae]KAE9057524.1 hypothetical protein PF006_g32395 [Phytophthora fragariae]KAE9160737.1 hypothetical protein PF002_g32548 [Phytophthora fragariae]